jgi:hypothetical protein
MTNIKFSITNDKLASLVRASLAAVALWAPAVALAQTPGTTVYQPNFYQVATNWNNVSVTNSAGVVFGAATNQQISIRQNSGDSWLLSYTTTNNSVGNITVAFSTSIDGTNWTTWPVPFTWSFSLPGTAVTNGCAWTNFANLYLNNARFVFPYAITNSCTTNTVLVNSVRESHANQ